MSRMLNDRAQALLKILVERYIVDGQPVGSRALARASSLELSPAVSERLPRVIELALEEAKTRA